MVGLFYFWVKHTAIMENTKISSLIPDDKNMNKHSQYGMHLLEKSISTLGLGRSIVVDKLGNVIGGNATLETAVNLGIEDCIVVETDGTKLVVVKRMDVDIDSKIGRELALADNAVANVNLEWDFEVMEQLQSEFNINAEEWGVVDFEESEELEKEQPQKEISTKLIIECDDLNKLGELMKEMQERGFNCELK